MEAALRIARNQIVERRARLRDFRLVTVDRLDLEQREVSLPFLRRTHLSGDRVTRPQVEALDLRRRHVDVVRAVEIVPVLTAQEAVAFGKNLEDAFAGEHDLLIEQFLLDAKDQVLFAHAVQIIDGDGL